MAARPNAKIATDHYVFIIAERTPADVAAVWTVGDIKFGKGGKQEPPPALR